jgi:hypothetical protein
MHNVAEYYDVGHVNFGDGEEDNGFDVVLTMHHR